MSILCIGRSDGGRGSVTKLAVLTLGVVLVVAGCASGAASTSSGTGSGSTPTVRILVNPGGEAQLPVYVAQASGIFKRNGLNVELVSNAQAIQPMLAGAADVAFPSPGVAVEANEQGFQTRIFMTLIDRVIQQLVVRNTLSLTATAGSWPAVVQALKGKTVGATVRGGAVDTNLRYLLTAAGLHPDKDVTIVDTGSVSALGAAFIAKRVDAALAVQPLAATLVTQAGAKPILDLSQGQGPATMAQPFITGVAKSSYIKAHPDVIKRLMKALRATQKYMSNPANVSAVVAIAQKDAFPGTSAEVVKSILGQLSATTTSVCFGSSDLDKINSVLEFQKAIKQPAAASTTIYRAAQQGYGCSGA